MTCSCARGCLYWILGKVSSLKVIGHWSKLPREVKLPWKCSKKCMAKALEDVI